MSSMVNNPRSAERWRLPDWGWVLVAVALARACVLPAFELVPQEAYYAYYAGHPALSYFDHPPLHQWIVHFAALAFG